MRKTLLMCPETKFKGRTVLSMDPRSDKLSYCATKHKTQNTKHKTQNTKEQTPVCDQSPPRDEQETGERSQHRSNTRTAQHEQQ